MINSAIRLMLPIIWLLLISTPSSASFEDDFLSEGDVVIRNVTLIDGLGNPPVTGHDLLIENGNYSRPGN